MYLVNETFYFLQDDTQEMVSVDVDIGSSEISDVAAVLHGVEESHGTMEYIINDV